MRAVTGELLAQRRKIHVGTMLGYQPLEAQPAPPFTAPARDLEHHHAAALRSPSVITVFMGRPS